MNLNNCYIVIHKNGKTYITPDAPIVGEKVGKSKHTIYTWFRQGKNIIDRWTQKGYIVIKGAEYIKSRRGKDNLTKERKKYNW